jgi:membrane fusion protein, multidrug efflux system
MRPFLFLSLISLPCVAQPVTIVSPSKGTIHRWVTLPSRLEANQKSVLHAKVSGHLKSITVDVGDTVKLGQEIARLEVPELEADRIKAIAEVEVTGITLRRLEAAKTKSPGVVFPQLIDEAEGRQRIAEASLKRTEVLLNYATVTAPFAGVITARHADLGAFIPAGGTGNDGATVTLSDLTTLRDHIQVPEHESKFIKPGTLARVLTSPTAAAIEAKVSRHSRQIESPSATLAVQVDLPNPDEKLTAGSYVKTQLAAETHTDALLVPAPAVLVEKTTFSVFIVKDGKAVKTKVTAGFVDTKNIEILDGLRGEEKLVILTGLTLTDGQAVTLTP